MRYRFYRGFPILHKIRLRIPVVHSRYNGMNDAFLHKKLSCRALLRPHTQISVSRSVGINQRVRKGAMNEALKKRVTRV